MGNDADGQMVKFGSRRKLQEDCWDYEKLIMNWIVKMLKTMIQ